MALLLLLTMLLLFDYRVWNNCNAWNNLELISSVNLDNSSWQSSFIDSVKGFLEDKVCEVFTNVIYICRN